MKINKIFWALSGILTLSLASCSTKEYAEYQPAQKESGSQVYFAADSETSFNLKDYESGYFEIPVYRVETSSAATAELSVKADAAFTIPTSVSFNAGETTAAIKVSWDDSKILEATDYNITIQITSESTKYGYDKYSFTCSKPAAWTELYTGHVYEVCWAEDYDVTMYYQETEFDGIRYCMLEDAWNDISGDEPVPTANYYFYWDTKTNNLFVPMQSIGMASSSGDIYTSDASGFYNAYQSWGIVVPSEQYFSWAPGWLAKNSFFQPYYDGNGGFYLADWMYLCQGGVPTGRGYQFGGNPDYFIADGFVRTTDFNDDDHIGSSEPAFTADASSQYFSQDGGVTPYVFETGARYTEPEDTNATTTTWYLTDYFGENYCLAFTAPIPDSKYLVTGAAITDVENDQFTGLYAQGNKLYVSIAGGSVKLKENETAYPIFTIKMKVYCKDDDGNKTYDFGTVTEVVSANGILQDNYTMEDLYGGYYDDYLGTWNMTATFESQSGLAEKSYDVQILEKVKNASFKIVNLSSYKSAFADTVTADYNSSYGILEVHPQALNAKYSGYDVSLGLLDFDSGYYYDTESVTIYGGICTDGNFAFVNAYTGYNICGFYYYVTVSGQASGLCGVYYVWGSYAGAASSPKFVMNKRKEYVTLDAQPKQVPSSVKMTKVSDKVTAVKNFTLSPVQKSGKSQKPVEQFVPGDSVNL